MLTQCPKCQTEQTIQPEHIENGLNMKCVACHAQLKMSIILAVHDLPEVPLKTDEAQSPAKRGLNTALVCIDGEATREVLTTVLEASDFHVLDIPSGIATFMSMKLNAPKIALVDAGFTDMPGTELISQIKNSPALAKIPLIMVTSMFEKNTKYRQEAPELYGADDFIDRDQIQKRLIPMIEKLLQKKTPQPDALPEETRSETPLEDFVTEETQEDDAFQEVEDLSEDALEPFIEQSDETFENAKAIAKDIISEIILQNEDKIEPSMDPGTFYDILGDEIMEGRQLFELKAPAYFDTSIYEDEIEHILGERAAREISDDIEAVGTDAPAPESIQDIISSPSFETLTDDPAISEPEDPGDIFKALEQEAQAALQEPEMPQAEYEPEDWNSPLLPDPENHDDVFEAMEEEAEAAVEKAETPEAPPFAASAPAPEDDAEEIKSAKRLAKIIVSDITIYNEAKVEQGLSENRFYEILEEEIHEGRVLFKTRVSEEIFNSGLYEDALEAYINTKKASADLAASYECPPDAEKETEIMEESDSPPKAEDQAYETPEIDLAPENENGFAEETHEEKEAKRLARIIVSDIVIYNENKVDEGIQSGAFYELLEEEIQEGRLLYESRVSQKILETRDYIKEAFEAFLKQRAAARA